MLLEWANRGLNLWTIEEGVMPLVQGQAAYDLPDDTVDVIDYAIRTGTGVGQSDLAITRISASSYSGIPNKNSPGRPLQLMVQRNVTNPILTVWPVPDNESYSLVYWRMRRIEDAGQGVQTQDMPFRFLPCVVAGLAYHLSMKLPGGMERTRMLKAVYDEQWDLAASEDRDRSSLFIIPRGYS
jgi:hypothetical protein